MRSTVVRWAEPGSTAPGIDIVCPTYNRSEQIGRTIESTLDQSVRDWRLIVVSDGSTDDTEDVVLSYTDPRICLVRSEPHGHPGGPRNIGLRHVQAPYVAYLDHDDHWHPDHLSTLLGSLEQGHDIVATGAVYIDAEQWEWGRTEPPDLVWHPDLQAAFALFEPSRVGHRRGIVEEVGGWTTDSTGFEDWDLWWRLGQAGHDFRPVLDRTAYIYRGSDTRTESVRSRFAVRVGVTTNEETARRSLETLRGSASQEHLADLYAADFAEWWDRLGASTRFAVPEGVSRNEVLRALKGRSDAARSHVFKELRYALQGEGCVLYDPAWCSSNEHAAHIGEIMATRDRRQRAYLSELLER